MPLIHPFFKTMSLDSTLYPVCVFSPFSTASVCVKEKREDTRSKCRLSNARKAKAEIQVYYMCMVCMCIPLLSEPSASFSRFSVSQTLSNPYTDFLDGNFFSLKLSCLSTKQPVSKGTRKQLPTLGYHLSLPLFLFVYRRLFPSFCFHSVPFF